MITHVNTVTVYVNDQDPSLQFWTDKVGFVKFSDMDGNVFLLRG